MESKGEHIVVEIRKTKTDKTASLGRNAPGSWLTL